jgi:multidrug resistance efflux pump
VAKRHHDAGDLVKKGDLLVVIEAPNNDREIQQARAAVAEADEQATRARQELDSARKAEEQARAGWERYRVLFSHGAVARQEVDRLHESLRGATASTSAAQDNLAAAEQNLEATRAKLNRLTGREPLEYVRAPFSGVITSRNCDSGAVVDAGSELFRMAEIATLRILVNAAFLNAQSIRAGQRATVLVSEVPNAAFAGTVVRAFAKEMEVEVPNPDRKLLPGMHGQVRIENGPVDNKENP